MTKWIDKELLERKVIIQHAAAGEHLPEYAVEKDWWVSMTLKALFQTSCKEYMEFKGLYVAIHKPLNTATSDSLHSESCLSDLQIQ